jgi:hypothetical protein
MRGASADRGGYMHDNFTSRHRTALKINFLDRYKQVKFRPIMMLKKPEKMQKI